MNRAAAIARNLGDSLNQIEEEFFRLVSFGDSSQLIDYLQVNFNEIDFYKRNQHGNTALELAILTKNDPIIFVLLSTGKFMPLDETLSFAIDFGYTNGINLILRHLAKPRLRLFGKRASGVNAAPKGDDDALFNESINKASISESAIDNEKITTVPDDTIDDEKDYEDYDLVIDSCVTEINDDSEKRRPSDGFSRLSEFKQPIKKTAFNRSFSSPDATVEDLKNFIQRKNSLYFKKAEESENCLDKALVCLLDPISALRKAAIAENFLVVKMLINSGVYIAEPIESERKNQSIDSLQDTNEMIRDYHALSTATYISLLAEDPVRMSFERSQKLKELARKYPENRETFVKLSNYCSAFAVDLLNECESAAEVKRLLCQDRDFIPLLSTVRFGRLHLAVHYGQKKFIAHPSCQHVVSTQWLSGLPQWNQWSPFMKTMHVMSQAILMIFLFIPYIIAPDSKLTSPVKVPMNRFIYASTCYCIFLGSLLTATVLKKNDEQWVTYISLIWMLSHILKLIFTDLPIQTSKFTSFWNMYDVIMALLFITSATLHINNENKDIDRLRAIEEGLFAVATILAFLRVLQWFHMHRTLGPFIMSLRNILIVVVQLLIVFTILYIAFTMGLYSLYSRKIISETDQGTDFTSFSSTVMNLYWALFGHGESEVKPINGAISSLNGTINGTDYEFTDWVGNGLWGLFHVAAVVILLNLLIAMMTNVFQKIQDNCDVEWKFARTQLWMSYFEEGNAIPPPFNTLIFIKNIFLFIKNWDLINKRPKKQVGRQRSTLQWKTMQEEASSNANANSIAIQMSSAKESTMEKKDDYSFFVDTLIRRYWRTRSFKETNTTS